MYRWLPHNAIQGCILSVYEYNRLPRPDLRWNLFIYCLVRLFSHFRSCTTFNKVVQQWTDSSWYSQYIYIYIGREVQRWTRKGMYQKTVFLDGLLLCSGVDIGGKGCIYVYILLALSLHSLYCDICFHQFWSCVIVLFLGSIICHLYIYMYIYICL